MKLDVSTVIDMMPIVHERADPSDRATAPFELYWSLQHADPWLRSTPSTGKWRFDSRY